MTRLRKSRSTRSRSRGKNLAHANSLRPFIVCFDEWTACRLAVLARDEADAVVRAQALTTADLWEAEVVDGGLEHFKAHTVSKETSN